MLRVKNFEPLNLGVPTPFGGKELELPIEECFALNGEGQWKPVPTPDEIDGEGTWAVPGIIDGYARLGEPGTEWKETIASGLQAAVAAGTTTVLVAPETRPALDCAEVVRFIRDRAEQVVGANAEVLGALFRSEGTKMVPAALSELARAGCVGFASGCHDVSGSVLQRALEWSSMLTRPVILRPYDSEIAEGGVAHRSPLSLRLGLPESSVVAESARVAREIEFARDLAVPVHISPISSARSVELLECAKKAGLPVTAGTTIHHLLLNEDAIADYNTDAKLVPPLRSEPDRKALCSAINRSLIEVIVSDHNPHEVEVKDCEFSRAEPGASGVQILLPGVLELIARGELEREPALKAVSVNPMRILLGRQSEDFTRCKDLVLLDPSKPFRLNAQSNRSLSRNCPLWGYELRGRARLAVSGTRAFLCPEEVD